MIGRGGATARERLREHLDAVRVVRDVEDEAPDALESPGNAHACERRRGLARRTRKRSPAASSMRERERQVRRLVRAGERRAQRRRIAVATRQSQRRARRASTSTSSTRTSSATTRTRDGAAPRARAPREASRMRGIALADHRRHARA